MPATNDGLVIFRDRDAFLNVRTGVSITNSHTSSVRSISHGLIAHTSPGHMQPSSYTRIMSLMMEPTCSIVASRMSSSIGWIGLFSSRAALL